MKGGEGRSVRETEVSVGADITSFLQLLQKKSGLAKMGLSVLAGWLAGFYKQNVSCMVCLCHHESSKLKSLKFEELRVELDSISEVPIRQTMDGFNWFDRSNNIMS
ncbi:hypothetical protein OIU85_012964 [Salix viminalis]|uniref:Uncharacterized protein n=1 Tax=Salix viminalis TaxID=40686 RepID=A0A9Q0NQI2_SALVM|nr:hypothetical protein OIU85_012964 [Salix viminalis]